MVSNISSVLLNRSEFGILTQVNTRRELHCKAQELLTEEGLSHYLQKREAFYEAILGAAVLIPEGEYDYEWLRLLQRVVESSDENTSGSLPLSVVPTQDGAVVETYSEVVRFSNNVLPIVDGDAPGEQYLNKLCSLTPAPENIVRLGKDAGIEILAAWVLEPSRSNPGATLKSLLPTPNQQNLKGLQRALVDETNKKDRELRENSASEALDNLTYVSRAGEFLGDISAILTRSPLKGTGWKQSTGSGGVRVHVASHIRKA